MAGERGNAGALESPVLRRHLADHRHHLDPGDRSRRRPAARDGAIWGAGNGPAVDPGGNIWVSTGNGSSGSAYGFQESVLKLDSSLNLLDHWAPPSWQSLDSGDVDLGSSEPVLLPNGLVFQIGKQGVGYLLRASHLDGTAASPAFQTPVCNGSFGGAVSSGGVIYVACSDGMRALALDTGTPSIAPLATWKVTSPAIGPPIVAGGLVWATDWSHGTLYGFSPQTGQAVVRESTPAMEHFASPAASDGKLFLATGQTVQAYTIATPAPPVMAPAAPAPPPPKCVLRLRTRRVKIHHPRRRGQHNHHRATFGTVSLVAKCNQTATVTLSGIVTERLSKKPRHGRARTRIIHLAKMRATLPAGAAKTLQLRLDPPVMRVLERRIRTSASFTLTGGNAGGTSRARAHARLSL